MSPRVEPAPDDDVAALVASAPVLEQVDLAITGMTCGSCAARIEKKLNRLDGVEASVNYATEAARVRVPEGTDPAELVAVVERTGYSAEVVDDGLGRGAGARRDGGDGPGSDAAAHHHDLPTDADGLRALRQRVVIAVLLATPVTVLAMVPPLQFRFWQWLSLTLAAPVVVWAGAPFHRAAWQNLRHGSATMDTLISVGTVAAFGWSVYALFWGGAGEPGMTMEFTLAPSRGGGEHEIYLEVAAAVTAFILLGRYAEAKAKARSSDALRTLLDLGAKEVAILRDGGIEERVPVDDLAVGDRFVVRPGEKVATDGTVEEGTSAIDASLLTGEPVPVEVGPGDELAGATVNAGGRLVVRATRVGADTALAQIGRLVADAQAGKAPVQRLADRISAVFVPIVMVVAAATLGFWLGAGDGASSAFTAGVAVLIIACPCALGLATPTALLVGTGRGAQLGILIKGPEILESTRRVDTIVLDKTGTVTTGRMELVDVVVAEGADHDVALRLTGALEDASEHPIAEAIADGARVRLDGPVPTVTGFANHEGLGVSGTVEGLEVVAGRRRLVEERGLVVSDELAAALDSAESAGRTPVLAGWDGQVRAVFVVADTPRRTSATAVERFRELGMTPVLLTGDNRRAAQAVATQVGIEQVIAEVLPADKVDAIAQLQSEGKVVAMVGDGVNDAAALARAELGIAMGSGTDVAIEASDLTLMRADLTAAADAVRLSRRTLAIIKGNLFWAFAYNTAAIPIAAAGMLNPMIAGAAMAVSSVFVVGNSLRLRRFSPTRR